MNIGKLKTALLLSYICMASVSAAIITPALSQIQSFFALSHGSIEWVISIFLFGYVIGQLIYAPLANRFGRLNAMRSGLVINLIGVLLCILSIYLQSYSLLLIGRLITALGAAAGLACTFILLNELLSQEQARHAMSFAIVAFTVGIGLAVSVGGLITEYLNWQYCFWILFLQGAVMLGFTWQFPETLKQPVQLNPLLILSGYTKALKSKRLIIFSLVVGFVSAFAYCYSAAAPLYAEETLNLSPSVYGSWNLINMLGMLFSGFLSAHLIKQYGPEKVLLIGFVLIVPCLISLLLISFSQHPYPLWFFSTTMFLYLFTGLLFPAASYLASNSIEDKASASSTMSFINMGSAMLAVIIMGYLSLQNIIAFALVLMVFFVIVGILVLNTLFMGR